MNDPIDLSAIELRNLRAVIAVADSGSFRGAARALGYTQSAVSHQVATLERSLEATLFTRPGGRGAVTLTSVGEVVHRRALRVLGELQTLTADVTALRSGERQTLRVGTFQTATTELLPAALRELRDHWPDLEVALYDSQANAETFDGLAAGDLDLALLVNPEPDERIHSIPLLDDPWVILTRRDSELASVQEPSFDLLDGVDLVAYNRRWRSQVVLEEAWRRRAIRPRVVYRTDDNLAMQRLVAAGYGHACLDRLGAGGVVEPSLTWLEPREILMQRTIALCVPRHRDLGLAAVSLMESVRTQYGA
jgi:DNA-binding transcriptional LysR family regulator